VWSRFLTGIIPSPIAQFLMFHRTVSCRPSM
jgi:hypothetical protein